MKLNKVLLMLTFLMFVSVGAFASQDEIKVNIDGVNVKTDVPAQVVNGRTLVPLRVIFEKYGIQVNWHQEAQIIEANKSGDSIVEMKLGLNSNMAMINNELRYLDQPPISINGRTMVPLRFISETLGSDVSWNQQTKTVNISKAPINIKEAKNYEKAFTDFLYKGDLHKILQKSYNNFFLTNDLAFSFFDVDKDGIPELLLIFETGHSQQRAIFEFKNGKIKTLFNELRETEDYGANHIYHEFYHDPLKKELYSMGVEKYTFWAERYTKQNGFRWVFEDSSVGGGEIIYHDHNFNEKNIKPLYMQPYYNIDF